MVEELKSGRMEQSMKYNGLIIRQRAKGHLFIQMETCMKEISQMIEQMVMGYIIIRMAQNIKGTGKMT